MRRKLVAQIVTLFILPLVALLAITLTDLPPQSKSVLPSEKVKSVPPDQSLVPKKLKITACDQDLNNFAATGPQSYPKYEQLLVVLPAIGVNNKKSFPNEGQVANPVHQKTKKSTLDPKWSQISLEDAGGTQASQSVVVANPHSEIGAGAFYEAAELPLPAAFISASSPSESDSVEAATIQKLRQQFNEEIAPHTHSASDQVYERKWMTARFQNDQMFKALMGHQAFLARERQSNWNNTNSFR